MAGAAAALALPTAAVAAQGHVRHTRKRSAPALMLRGVTVSAGGKATKRTVLVNGAGRAVYLLTGDSARHPKCTGSSCLAIWPALTTRTMKVTVGKGVSGKVTVWRHHGVDQIEIAGHPLYLYAGDSGSGQTKGEGVKSFGGTWDLLSGSGRVVPVPKKSGSGSGGGSSWG
ncbi:MAG: COG4315 family predicted lipoprotein [Solirubrobacteraceae bacterium]